MGYNPSQGGSSSVAGAVVLKGAWDASGGTFPGSGSAQTGWSYRVSVAGTVDSVEFLVGDEITAITDDASSSTYASNWLKNDNTDLTGSEIKSAYGGEADTNALMDALKAKVDYLTVTASTNLDTIRSRVDDLDTIRSRVDDLDMAVMFLKGSRKAKAILRKR